MTSVASERPVKYLLGTNVISELAAKQPDPQVIAWIDALDLYSIYLSVMGELSKGIEKLPDSPRKDTGVIVINPWK